MAHHEPQFDSNSTAQHRRRSAASRVVLAVALAALGLAAPAIPAAAADCPAGGVTDWDGLVSVFTNGGAATLCNSVSAVAAGDGLAVGSGKTVMLDLNSFDLDISSVAANEDAISVPAGTSLTIDDTSTDSPVDAGTLTATGGDSGAGIGVSVDGTVTITGGNVIATGTDDAAGIGGHIASGAGTVAITGGTVTAVGGASAAGIGGGLNGAGGAVTIGPGATVTASGGSTAIGAGTGGISFGGLSNAGTLIIPTGAALTIPSGITVTNSGTIQGGGTLTGDGTVDNNGSLARTLTVDGTVSVSGYHYTVSFDANGGTLNWFGAPWSILNGPTLASAGRTVADLPETSRSDYEFTGWYFTFDGSGPALDSVTGFPGSSADGEPIYVTLYAGWAAHPTLYAYPNGGATAPAACPARTALTDACTLTQALDLAHSGDTIILAADPGTGDTATFDTTSGWTVPQDTLTIRPDDGVEATLDGGDQAPFLLNYTGNGTLAVSGLTVTGSVGATAPLGTAPAAGGIAVTGDGALTVAASTFTKNTSITTSADVGTSAPRTGGGIVATGSGDVDVSASTFTDNVTSALSGSQAFGGGIRIVSGTLTVSESTFSGNDASAATGAAFTAGGGIVTILGDATVIASTFVDNTVSDGPAFGGGLVNGSGTLDGGSFAVAGLLFAGNSASCTVVPSASPVVDAGYNIASDGTCDFTDPTSMSGSDRLADTLGALADTGGPTKTIAPQAGSPALGMIPVDTSVTSGGSSVTLCPTVDQRGIPSGDGLPCNAGSVQNLTPIAVSALSLPDGRVGTDYAPQVLTASGGTGTYAWSIADGALPDGLRLDASSGTITGTPTASGTFRFTVQATGRAGLTATLALSIAVSTAESTETVQPSTPPSSPSETPAPLTVETASLPSGVVGEEYHQELHASGAADGVYHWIVSDGALPDGLQLSDEGVISGTPTVAGTFEFTVSVNDPALAELSIVIQPAEELAETGVPGSLMPTGIAAVVLVVLGGLMVFVTSRRRRTSS